MNVLYFVLTDLVSDSKSGISKKIKAQIYALKAQGINLKVYGFTKNNYYSHVLNDDILIETTTEINLYKRINDIILDNSNWTSKILFRYPFASYDLLKLVSRYPNQIYFEHNTFEEVEALLNQKKHFYSLPVKLSYSYFKYWIRTFLFKQTIEKKIGTKILSLAKAGICVTHEISNYEKKRYNKYKTAVISNGTELFLNQDLKAPVFENTLKIVMLIGNESAWHGIDRIFKGLKRFKNNDFNIVVDIYGSVGLHFNQTILPKNCKINFLEKTDKTELINKYHIAFSSLAMYKIGMNEACSLKLRDSMLMGYPVVLGYHDTDVSNNNLFSNYILQVSNTNQPLDFNQILNFYFKVSKINNYQFKIKSLAESNFSYEVKAKELISFLEKN